MDYHEQDFEQVFLRSERPRRATGTGQRRQAPVSLVSYRIDRREDRLLGAYWVKKAEVDSGKRASVPTELAERMKAMKQENRELLQANDILCKASAYFEIAELDRRSK